MLNVTGQGFEHKVKRSAMNGRIIGVKHEMYFFAWSRNEFQIILVCISQKPRNCLGRIRA